MDTRIKKLKILYIGFGLDPFTKGGAVLYQQQIMEAITRKGIKVSVFLSAPRYTLSNNPFLKTWHKNGIKFIELYNPPCKLGVQNDPLVQCSHLAIEEMTKKILKEEKPDIVHIHELQLHPASIINIIAEAGIKSVKTIHNYYDICPQRDLFYRGQKYCTFFPSVEHCAECMSVKPIKKRNNLSFLIKEVKNFVKYFISKKIINKYRAVRFADKIIKKSNKEYNASVAPMYSNEKYNYRQKFFVEMLNKLDAIHCSSYRPGEIFSVAGVLKNKIIPISLSTENIKNIKPKPLRDNCYPVVFGYIGGTAIQKGFNVLVEAFSKLDQKKAKLIIWNAKTKQMPPTHKNTNLNIEIHQSYNLEEINHIFEKIDIGVVPSIWEESFALIGPEFLSAKIPVIGSKIGGIPEWLKNEENGFFVRPGDASDLAEKMNLFVQNPLLISQFQRQIKPWKKFEQHIDEIISLYNNLIK